MQVGSGLNVHPFLAYRLVVRAGRAAVLAERAGLDSGVETAGCTGDTGKLYCSDDWTQVNSTTLSEMYLSSILFNNWIVITF